MSLTNPGFINRYEEIYGLSGTLGRCFEHLFLKDLYKVEITLMPTYKHTQLETMDPIIENDKQSWVDKICENILVQITLYERAALVICLTNDKVKQISDTVKSLFPGIKIHKYTDDDEQLPKAIVDPMDVVFFTNYAGRGTDIKTSAELEANGGLHVIVTFMPNNSRVERQAFGRTARQGKKGTAQLILNKCDMDEDLFDQNMDILAKRDQLVEQSFEKCKKEALPKLLARERLFEKFSTFMAEVRKSTADAVGGNLEILAQIEEHWGFWLREKVEMRDKNAPMPSETELDAFIVDERRKAKDLSIFTNPCYLVMKGYNLDYGNAINHLEKAIKLDENQSGFAAPAHYYMALALVKKDHYISVKECEVCLDNQQKAAEHLNKAIELINNKLIPWLSRGVLRPGEKNGDGEGNEQNTEFCQQILNKVQLLRQLSDQCEKWFNVSVKDLSVLGNSSIYYHYDLYSGSTVHRRLFIAECPEGHVCKFKGWVQPDPDKKLPQREVAEFGTFGVFEFYELDYVKPPKAWGSIFWMAFLGVAQVCVGVYFACTGAFALAVPFLKCGISDIVEAARAAVGDTVISWGKNLIGKILEYGPVLARWATGLLSKCKSGIGKWLFKCADRIGLKPLETVSPTCIGFADQRRAFLTDVFVSSSVTELKPENHSFLDYATFARDAENSEMPNMWQRKRHCQLEKLLAATGQMMDHPINISVNRLSAPKSKANRNDVRIDVRVAQNYSNKAEEERNQIRDTACGNSKATKKALYRAQTKRFTGVQTLRGLVNADCRSLWMTLRAKTAVADSPYFDEILLRHLDEELAIFASPRQLHMLKKSAIIVSDGTFKQAPKGIYQVYRVFGFAGGTHAVPLCTALMRGNIAPN
uniref:Uncharacterized protein n=1 Tax=Globodera rostochiensis TaxID=31243 RepID=A0A914H745_GLORO